jgi:hypothetical protein
MINFADVKSIAIPEGNVRSVSFGGVVVWKLGMLNLVPYSIGEDGTVYNNGLGYMDDYRLNSSGVPTAMTGATHSGFITFSNTDIIRAKGSAAPSSSGGQYIAFYDENFNKILSITLSALEPRPSTTYELQSDGQYLLTVDIATALTDTAVGTDVIANAKYFRVSFASCKGEDMIITINEEIT